jgi:hypothetical protein
MAQQHTPAEGIGKTVGADHIWTVRHLENALARERIIAMRFMMLERTNWAESPETEALFIASCALRKEAERYLELAKSEGQLLMCWEGSTVLALASQGGAA